MITSSSSSNSLDTSTAEPNSTIYQLLANARDKRTGNLVTTKLTKNQEILRGYQTLERDPFSQSPEAIRIWDLIFDFYEVNSRMGSYFDAHPTLEALVVDPADNNRLFKLDKNRRYRGYVFTFHELTYQDVYHVRPSDLAELDPKSQADYGTPINLIGELPANETPEVLRNTMFSKAEMLSNVHPTLEELAYALPEGASRDRYRCFIVNCPLCGHLKKTSEAVKKIGFLNKQVNVTLGLPLDDWRNIEYDELRFYKDTVLESSETLMQTAELSDLDIKAEDSVRRFRNENEV